MSVALALCVGVTAAQAVPDVNPIVVASVFFAAKTLYLFFLPQGKRISNVLFAGVNQEIWIDELRENFYAIDQSDDPLNGVADWSEWERRTHRH